MKRTTLIVLLLIATCLVIGIYFIYQEYFSDNNRTRRVLQFLRNPESQQATMQSALSRCDDAPFMLPTSGLIGFLWDDSFRPGHHHQGIDIFAGIVAGETPVYAAYAGYLTRLSDWKSSLIIRIPSDPLHPGQQIWTYYTHLAHPSGASLIAEAFPPGSKEVYLSAGTFLGYQGNYSGTPGNPTGVHLHFSIVKDDGRGQFLNELEINNTLDPSPYFGMPLNGNLNKEEIPICLNP